MSDYLGKYCLVTTSQQRYNMKPDVQKGGVVLITRRFEDALYDEYDRLFFKEELLPLPNFEGTEDEVRIAREMYLKLTQIS